MKSYIKIFIVICLSIAGGILFGVVLFHVSQLPPDALAKQALIEQLDSDDNDAALSAAEDLAYYGWLFDGTLENRVFDAASLEGVNFSNAYLVGTSFVSVRFGDATLDNANLSGANLERTYLYLGVLPGAILKNANLVDADLRIANLSGVDFSGATIQHAMLNASNLQGANFNGANLQTVWLMASYLQGSDLRDADLTDANLTNAQVDDILMDATTRLPDSTFWTPETDLTRFTNPDHPDYWQPPRRD